MGNDDTGGVPLPVWFIWSIGSSVTTKCKYTNNPIEIDPMHAEFTSQSNNYLILLSNLADQQTAKREYLHSLTASNTVLWVNTINNTNATIASYLVTSMFTYMPDLNTVAWFWTQEANDVGFTLLMLNNANGVVNSMVQYSYGNTSMVAIYQINVVYSPGSPFIYLSF